MYIAQTWGLLGRNWLLIPENSSGQFQRDLHIDLNSNQNHYL
jgi:hypothetical protein